MENLTKLWGDQVEEPPTHIRGILQTKDYEHFMILSDTGDLLHEFQGATLANRCLPGDHVGWVNGSCDLELRDQHPLLVGTLALTSKSTYGMTKRGHMMYLCTPYDTRYPAFIVGSSEKDRTQNRIVLISFQDWTSTFPRGTIQQTLGISGEEYAEHEALIWQACPWRYPVFDYDPTLHNKAEREELHGVTFHVDPEGCCDIDDVITVKLVSDVWHITITISDVASYVEENGAVDIMASLIGQTLYSAEGHVLRPMLPSDYSEKTCSLLPGKTSEGVSLQFTWCPATKCIEDIRWFQSRVHVNISYTYEVFEASSPYRMLIRDIASFWKGEPVEDAHEWIAQFMIFYNTEAGKKLKEAGMGILRRHAAPDYIRLSTYMEHVPECTVLAQSAAEYCLAEEDNTAHIGLNAEAYAHASSPIRRYADLINQRILIRLIQGKTDRWIVPQAMYDMNVRGKAIRRFARDVDFLKAIMNNNEFDAIIMETDADDHQIRVKLYVPEWKRMISTSYRVINGAVVSRDETDVMDVSLYRRVRIRCAFSPNARNWKERAVIHMV